MRKHLHSRNHIEICSLEHAQPRPVIYTCHILSHRPANQQTNRLLVIIRLSLSTFSTVHFSVTVQPSAPVLLSEVGRWNGQTHTIKVFSLTLHSTDSQCLCLAHAHTHTMWHLHNLLAMDAICSTHTLSTLIRLQQAVFTNLYAPCTRACLTNAQRNKP